MIRKTLTQLGLSFIALFFVASCIDDSDVQYYDAAGQFKKDSVLIDNYLDENQITEARELIYLEGMQSVKTGIYYEMLEVGSGDVSPTQTSVVSAKYKGMLLNGIVFSETENNKSAIIPVFDAINGLKLLLPKFNVGDSVRVIIPSFYGYQDNSINNVPANSVLIFNLRITSTDDMDIENYCETNVLTTTEIIEDSRETGIHIGITEEGTNEPDKHPTTSDLVKVKYKGYLLDGTVFDETKDDETASFYLSNVIKGWEYAIPKMSKGDKATILIPSYYGYGGYSKDKIPSYSTLCFDVELVDY